MTPAEKEKIVVVAGPTASGKTAVALDIALEFGGEIIGADSLQVYRRFDIGSAKPGKAELNKVPHHLIDAADPDEEFTAARFRAEAQRLIAGIAGRGRLPIVAGGTGLYIKALTEGLFEGPEGDQGLRDSLLREAQLKGKGHLYERLKEVDPVSAARTHPNNLRRIIRALEVFHLSERPISVHHRDHAFAEKPYDALKIGLVVERDELYRRIDERVDKMMRAGLVDEVRGLLRDGYSPDLKPMGSLGYKEVLGFIEGKYSLDEAARLIKRNTRHYAKRQLTWFRKDSEIVWIDPKEKEGIRELVRAHICRGSS